MDPDVSSPRSLTRVLGLFDAIAKTPAGLTLTEVSAALDSPKSSLLLLLRPLVARDYLIHADGRYRLGPAIFRLAADILAVRKFPGLIRPFMEDLVGKSGETAYLAVIDREARMSTYVEGVESPQAVRYWVPVGVARGLYCSAAGQLLLAYQDEAWREAYLATADLRRLTPRTITDPAELRRKLAEIRETGIAVSIGEAIPGAAGIAAPIFQADGSVVAALLIGAPAERFDRKLPELRTLIAEAAARASSAMGYAGHRPPAAAARA